LSSKKRKQERKVVVNSSPFKNNKVKPKTKNQRNLLRSIYGNDITFCIGPAGTGKTHVSVGAAVDLLQRKKIEKIIISRPIMEAGQKRNSKSVIGYLPGDINAKMAPFLRPIHDELGKFLTQDAIQMMKNTGVLEICPIEHMRGRTFEKSFIIIDEAQNTTEEQLEMVLTRLGIGSIMVLVGDTEQSDLPANLEGGLENFIEDLDGLEGLGIIYLETCDVARHPIVAAILEKRKQIKILLKGPVSLERINYDGQSTRHSSKDFSSQCKHDAYSDNRLDGLLQKNIQGNDLS
jgi:phosphate starvation-inducible protein PhoH and related proteins